MNQPNQFFTEETLTRHRHWEWIYIQINESRTEKESNKLYYGKENILIESDWLIKFTTDNSNPTSNSRLKEHLKASVVQLIRVKNTEGCENVLIKDKSCVLNRM